MKKLLGCFLCVMLLVFLAMPAAADTIVFDIDPPDINSLYWSGSDVNPASNLNNSGIETEQAWLQALLDDTSVELLYKDEDDSDGWVSPSGWTYAVLKYGQGQPAPYGFDHWAIMDDGDGILTLGDVGGGFTLDFKALSHVSYDTPVPEPATMLLLGSGLIGLAGFGRKKFITG